MYKFERINDDKFKVIGTGKEFEFTRVVEIAKELQSMDIKKTIKLIEFLAERGETIETTKLRVQRQEGNKTIIDESNLEAIKKEFEKPIMTEIIDNILKKQINRNMEQFISELGVEINEAATFGRDFVFALVNGVSEDTPRK